MTIDPQVQMILAAMGTQDPVPMSEVMPGLMRTRLDSTATPRRDIGLARVEDSTIATVPVRTYTPDELGTPGVVIFLHGGGFTVGSLVSHDALAARLTVATGSRLVSVAYRLAPEHRFPAAVEDCWAVTQSLAAEGKPIALVGDSAGANLATVVALKARDAGVPIAHQTLLYPAIDLRAGATYPSRIECGDDYLLTSEMRKWFDGHYLESPADAEDWRAVPLLADLGGVAPALVITAQYDPLRDEGELYGRRLGASGVATVVHRYEGMIHGFAQFPVTQADDVVREAAGAIRDSFDQPDG
jgi:acetyl esterase